MGGGGASERKGVVRGRWRVEGVARVLWVWLD